jgi:regulation of enolase protein 1 (concanavalin A-like superfamily)
VGDPALKGAIVYDLESQSYTVTGAGRNMWFDRDEFHFVWKRLKGDFILRAHARFVGEGSDPHRKLGWMVRSSLEAGSPHVNAVVHGDGLTSLQFRRSAGGPTEEIKSTLTAAEVIQLERRGDRFTMSVAREGETWTRTELADHDAMGEEVLVGLFVCSHHPEVLEKAVFRNVRVTIPASATFVPYRDYLGSRLETLDVDTGERRVLWETPEPIEAPNWTPDGTTLIYNSRGRLFRFSLADGTTVPLDTGFATRCNNDHVLSFDGTMMGISHHAPEAGGKSVIYVLPATGGVPRRVTEHGPSYLHGWSPDGRSLVFTGERDGEFDIYRVPAEGGAEVRLTSAEGLDDGSEYSPDGAWIYFNSARTGRMQLWRMRPDGTGQERLTHGELNDWFPHVSPDGKRLVFLTFGPEVAADDHPYYRHVYLRMMPAEGGEPKVVAYLYGGQGTINVPSWSPDNRRVAFVSHTGR